MRVGGGTRVPPIVHPSAAIEIVWRHPSAANRRAWRYWSAAIKRVIHRHGDGQWRHPSAVFRDVRDLVADSAALAGVDRRAVFPGAVDDPELEAAFAELVEALADHPVAVAGLLHELVNGHLAAPGLVVGIVSDDQGYQPLPGGPVIGSMVLDLPIQRVTHVIPHRDRAWKCACPSPRVGVGKRGPGHALWPARPGPRSSRGDASPKATRPGRSLRSGCAGDGRDLAGSVGGRD